MPATNHHSFGVSIALIAAMVAATLLAVLLLWHKPASAVSLTAVSGTTITVNTDANESNSDGDCSLREAIEAANQNAAVDECMAGSATEQDVIHFSLGKEATINVNFLPLPTVIDGAGLLIDGREASITVSGDDSMRLFLVDEGAKLAIKNLTVAHGSSSRVGGAFQNFGGTLEVINSTLSGNRASLGEEGGSGGAISNNFGTLKVINSTFSGNSAKGDPQSGFGGAIANSSGTATVTNSTFSGNSAQGGGAISNHNDGTIKVRSSTFSGNKAFAGGAIYNTGGTLEATNSTFSGNSANLGGEEGGGGAIVNDGTATLTNSTLSGNTTSASGAGIFNAGTVNLSNTIIANSLSGENCFNEGTINDLGYNIDSGNTCSFSAEGSLSNTDPLLNELANNGGPTKTHALQPGSAAIDRITSSCPPPATDQRGVARPKDGDGNGTNLCDIGAYERSDLTPPKVTTTDPTSGETGVRRNTTLTATFSEKMIRSTLNNATFKLSRCASATDAACNTSVTNVTVTPSSNGLSATLNPFGSTSTLLAANTKYKAILTSGAKDLAGNALDQNSSTVGKQPKIWYFTTGST